MSRLVVVSNRVADPRKAAAGGLAVALGDSLQQTGGLWFGWERHGAAGRHARRRRCVAAHAAGRQGHARHHRPVAAGPRQLLPRYSNDVLWPVFHYRLDLAHFDAGFIDGYRRVNKLFARQLLPLLRPDDTVWIQDYHLIPLAEELRALGCRQRIGFFLHIPLPPPLILAAIPQHEWLVRSLFACDLVGFQSEADVDHFARYVGVEVGAEALDRYHYRAFGRTVRAQAFPIGIDVDEFTALAEAGKRATCTRPSSASTRRGGCWWASTGSTTPRACRTGCGRFATCWRAFRKTAAARP